jgi:hypothetical protein
MSDINNPTSNIHLAKESPARRAGSEEDMVGTAIWLSSKAGSFMNGKIVGIVKMRWLEALIHSLIIEGWEAP